MKHNNGKRRNEPKNQKQRKRYTQPENMRPFFLITLGHAEWPSRKHVTKPVILERILKAFDCVSVVISEESHTQKGAFHFHVAVHARNANRYTYIRLILKAFPEFDGPSCDIKAHRKLATAVAYAVKEDPNPLIWGDPIDWDSVEAANRWINRKEKDIESQQRGTSAPHAQGVQLQAQQALYARMEQLKAQGDELQTRVGQLIEALEAEREAISQFINAFLETQRELLNRVASIEETLKSGKAPREEGAVQREGPGTVTGGKGEEGPTTTSHTPPHTLSPTGPMGGDPPNPP